MPGESGGLGMRLERCAGANSCKIVAIGEELRSYSDYNRKQCNDCKQGTGMVKPILSKDYSDYSMENRLKV
jgi:hypothetical protein